MTDELLEFVNWLKEKGVTHVAMESTSVYWKPLYNLLELEQIETLVVNARHIKAVPGRKTDMKDAEWIANLLRHGLLKGSYIPDRAQRELRELVRYRRSLIEERARELNRIQKYWKERTSSCRPLFPISMGHRHENDSCVDRRENDPMVIAQLAKGKLKQK